MPVFEKHPLVVAQPAFVEHSDRNVMESWHNTRARIALTKT